MATTQDLMNAIAQMEGYNTTGSIAQRNNNPGNLRWDSRQVGQENTVNGKYATFASPQEGWDALQRYVEKKQQSGDTLRSFIYRYAPPSENDTSNYLGWLVGKLGIGADDRISLLGQTGGDPLSTEEYDIPDTTYTGDWMSEVVDYGEIGMYAALGITGILVLSTILGRR